MSGFTAMGILQVCRTHDAKIKRWGKFSAIGNDYRAAWAQL